MINDNMIVKLIQFSGKEILLDISNMDTIAEFRKKIANLIKKPVYWIKLINNLEIIYGNDKIIDRLNNNTLINLVIVNSSIKKTISSGVNHIAAITTNNRVICWGIDFHNKVFNVPKLFFDENFIMISANNNYTAAITSYGRVICWGDDKYDISSNIPKLNYNEKYNIYISHL